MEPAANPNKLPIGPPRRNPPTADPIDRLKFLALSISLSIILVYTLGTTIYLVRVLT